MLKNHLTMLYDYNYWANARILEPMSKLSEAQFNQPMSPNHGSLRTTLIHTLAAEWIWRSRCQEGVSPVGLLNEADFPTLATIQAYWANEEAKMRDFVASLDDEALAKNVTYKTTEGGDSAQNLAQILTHVVIHGMQHRAEMAMQLTDFGHSPGNIDLIIYARTLE